MSKVVKRINVNILGYPYVLEYLEGDLPIEEGDENNDANGLIIQGRYYANKMKILVRDDLPKPRKQLVLYHELIHLYDDVLNIRDDGKDLSEAECNRIALVVQLIVNGGLK